MPKIFPLYFVITLLFQNFHYPKTSLQFLKHKKNYFLNFKFKRCLDQQYISRENNFKGKGQCTSGKLI